MKRNYPQSECGLIIEGEDMEASIKLEMDETKTYANQNFFLSYQEKAYSQGKIPDFLNKREMKQFQQIQKEMFYHSIISPLIPKGMNQEIRVKKKKKLYKKKN